MSENGLIQGLSSIKRHQEELKAKQEAANRPKADWLTSIFPKKTGDSIEVRFMQEMDEDMSNYREDRGTGFIAVEHQAPGLEGFKRRALCSLDSEGQCYADERHQQNYQEGWRQRQNLYLNVAVKFEGEVKPYILSRNANSSFAQSLIQEAIDEGSLTDSMYRITKTGEGTKTNWLLKRLPKAELLDDSGIEPWDLKEYAIRSVPYAEQAAYYGAVYKGPEDDHSEPSSQPDEEW